MKEIKDLKKMGRQIAKLNLAMMSIFPLLIYRFNAIPIKISARNFLDTD